jgi:CheY-like chemotaxis protein
MKDNPVNMMLLSTYMRKNNWPFESDENGLLALQTFESRPQGFDVIFMGNSPPQKKNITSTYILLLSRVQKDVSMPVMSGYESTRAIRAIELSRRLSGGTNRPALIIALTGFSSQKDQEMAFESGVDIFMTKPVRFKEVGKILEAWMRGA